MALDGITLKAIKYELKEELIGGRIDKIYQPQTDLITLQIRQPGKNINLIISANPQKPRIHLSNETFDNPLRPPAFCMLLRKHLISGRIKEIEQPDFERILKIIIQYKNNKGKLEKKILIVELMGRHSNIILLKEDQQILDSIKRITSDINRYREILPGKEYIPPPKQNKKNPLTTDFSKFNQLLKENLGEKIYRVIMNNYRGISPIIASEIAYRADFNRKDKLTNQEEIRRLWENFKEIIEKIKENNYKPEVIMSQKNDPQEYAAIPLKQFKLPVKRFNSMNRSMEFYFINKITNQKIKNLTTQMNRIISSNKDKAYKKYKKVSGQLKGAYNADKYKLKGELITANIYQLKKGESSVKLPNYYQNNKEVTITLDSQLTPAENAQKYFKKYEKAKRSIKYLENEKRKDKNEINYLKQVEVNIEQAEEVAELEEIHEELVNEGYIRKQKRNRQKHQKKLPPLKFKSSNDYDILVGRNNRQNDKLTKKIANNQDLWFHVKDISGSHTIVRNHTQDEIPEDTILEAAQVAAFYSKGRNSSNVPVDYTLVKDVKKPKGAKPGMVYYENQSTLYVNPDEELVQNLKIDKE